MKMPLRCHCGAVRGEMDTERAYARATCYCKDCRAFARFLGVPGVLDASGGTDIVPVAPAAVRIDIRDDGQRSERIREGNGITGMRERLAAHGVPVLDARPSELGPELVGQYLAWKKAGVL